MKPRLIEIYGEDLFANLDMLKLLNEDLRIRVANYIRAHSKMYDLVVNSELWGGDIELRVLSNLFDIIICQIDLLNIIHETCLKPVYYGEDNSSATQCVLIYYNGIDHFDPIYMINVKNPNDKITIFDPNDPVVNDHLKTFIKDKLKYYGDVILGVNSSIRVQGISCGEHSKRKELFSLKIKTTSQLATENTSLKRKELTLDDIRMSSNNSIQIPISIPDDYYSLNKPVKITTETVDQISAWHDHHSKRMKIKESTQDEYVHVENENLEETPGPSMIPKDDDETEGAHQ